MTQLEFDVVLCSLVLVLHHVLYMDLILVQGGMFPLLLSVYCTFELASL
jgi:hypothetical protein